MIVRWHSLCADMHVFGHDTSGARGLPESSGVCSCVRVPKAVSIEDVLRCRVDTGQESEKSGENTGSPLIKGWPSEWSLSFRL